MIEVDQTVVDEEMRETKRKRMVFTENLAHGTNVVGDSRGGFVVHHADRFHGVRVIRLQLLLQ